MNGEFSKLDETDNKHRKKFLEKMRNAKPVKPPIRWGECFVTGVIGGIFVLMIFIVGTLTAFYADPDGQAIYHARKASLERDITLAVKAAVQEKDATIADLQAKLGESLKSSSVNLITTQETSPLNAIGYISLAVTSLLMIGYAISLFKGRSVIVTVLFLVLALIVGSVGIGEIGTDKKEIATCQIHGELVTEESELPAGCYIKTDRSESPCNCYLARIIPCMENKIETVPIIAEFGEKFTSENRYYDIRYGLTYISDAILSTTKGRYAGARWPSSKTYFGDWLDSANKISHQIENQDPN